MNFVRELLFVKTVNNYKDLHFFCQKKKNEVFCSKYNSLVKKKMFKLIDLEYKEPKNFIYVMNNVKFSEIKDKSGKYNYDKIYDLYLKFLHENQIFCKNKKITSFPFYPYLEYLNISDNNLDNIPVLPNLKHLEISFNNIKHFKEFPKLEYLSIHEQKNLTKFEPQPRLKELRITYNNLKTFPSHNNLIYLDIQGNKLLSKIDVQPKLETLYITETSIKTLPTMPKLKDLEIHWNDKLTSIESQPRLESIYISKNKEYLVKGACKNCKVYLMSN